MRPLPEFGREILAPHLDGFNIIGCAIRSKEMLYFLARRDYRRTEQFRATQEPPDELDLEKRVLSCFLDEPPGLAFGHTALHDFELPWCAASLAPKPQFVCVSLDGLPFAIGSGEAGIEKGLAARGAITRLRRVGAHVYAVGTRRVAYRRDGREQWHEHSRGIALSRPEEALGFLDIAGFDEQDMYAVGGVADVWHFDGRRWRQCSFPDPARLCAVCCGGDGYVYVCAQDGAIYRGRGDSWAQLAPATHALPVRDMVWFQDRVWCSSEAGLCCIAEGRLDAVELPAGVQVCSGHLDTCDGLLLLAGYGGAAVLDHQGWRVLFHGSD